MSFKEKVLKSETLVLKTTVWCDSQIARYSHKMLLFVFNQGKSKNALPKKLQGNDERVFQTLNSTINSIAN